MYTEVTELQTNDSTVQSLHSASMVTRQLADKPTRGQSSRGLVNSRTSQLAEMFGLKFGVYNCSKCYLGHIYYLYAANIQ